MNGGAREHRGRTCLEEPGPDPRFDPVPRRHDEPHAHRDRPPATPFALHRCGENHHHQCRPRNRAYPAHVRRPRCRARLDWSAPHPRPAHRLARRLPRRIWIHPLWRRREGARRRNARIGVEPVDPRVRREQYREPDGHRLHRRSDGADRHRHAHRIPPDHLPGLYRPRDIGHDARDRSRRAGMGARAPLPQHAQRRARRTRSALRPLDTLGREHPAHPYDLPDAPPRAIPARRSTLHCRAARGHGRRRPECQPHEHPASPRLLPTAARGHPVVQPALHPLLRQAPPAHPHPLRREVPRRTPALAQPPDDPSGLEGGDSRGARGRRPRQRRGHAQERSPGPERGRGSAAPHHTGGFRSSGRRAHPLRIPD